ncbi:MAG: ATP-binding protein, partial [Nanoarchaeota archaeon]|nr:ATP-binding protein [Nanoarchaeota archaeon]
DVIGCTERQGDQGQYVLKIRDKGMGIEPSTLDSIFEPHKGRPEHGKTVHQAREFVQTYGGEFTLYSAVGAGTEVQFTIPYVWDKYEFPEQKQESTI